MGGDVFIDSEMFLITDFISLKIRPTQFFKGVPKDKIYIYIYMFIKISSRTYINIYIITVFQKNITDIA
jgi:hypothetical protein